MTAPKVVGVGCFARPEVLRRVFQKTLESYILGSLEKLFPEWHFNNSDEVMIPSLEDIISDGTEKDRFNRFKMGPKFEPVRITGFFFGFEKQGLNLSLFFQAADRKPVRYSTRLQKFTKIRTTVSTECAP
jgi:hypothetical protein